jgi:Putative peptidoglycan binding domain
MAAQFDAKSVQGDLIGLGYLSKGADDGHFGPGSQRALKRFQRHAARVYRMSSANNQPADVAAGNAFKGAATGVVDQATLDEIKSWMANKWKLPLNRFPFKKIANGTLRGDVADEWSKLVTKIKGLGGTIDGPYGDTKRHLGKASKVGASSFSFHIVGRAIDLNQGLAGPPGKRYYVAKDTGNGTIGYWRIYCTPEKQDGTQGKAFEKDAVDCWDFYSKKAYKLPPGHYLDLTREIESDGKFERIPAQKGWEANYNQTEWWHFQYKLGKQETFLDECELVGYSEQDLKTAGYSTNDMDRRPG